MFTFYLIIDNKMSCSYFVKKNNRNCLLKPHKNNIIDTKLYCTKHYNLLQNSTDIKSERHKIQCEKILRTKSQCKSFTSIMNEHGRYYCKRHFTNNIEEASDITYIHCEFKDCSSKYTKEYNSVKYCTKHYNIILNDENKEVLNLIDNLEKLSIQTNSTNLNVLKKDAFKLLLKIHPDKCKNSKIDSHVLTQKVNMIMAKHK
jgi:hypothetical protein